MMRMCNGSNPLAISEGECFWSMPRSPSTISVERKSEIHVSVRDPRTHIHHGRALFTDYKINIKTHGSSYLVLSQSTVRRRYSEFVWLHDKLAREIPNESLSDLPSLPGKRMFGRFDIEFILVRQKSLAEYLQSLVKDEAILGNACLQLFLQTKFTIKQIEHCSKYKDPSDIRHVILLATANSRDNPLYFRSRHSSSDSALESSYSSLDLNDVLPRDKPDALSSGYYGDDEVPDMSDQSPKSSPGTQEMKKLFVSEISGELVQSSSSDFELSEVEDSPCRNEKRGRSTNRAVFVGELGPSCSGVVVLEFLYSVPERDTETYVVYAARDDGNGTRQREETHDQRIKRLVNEYEIMSLL